MVPTNTAYMQYCYNDSVNLVDKRQTDIRRNLSDIVEERGAVMCSYPFIR